MRKIGTSKYATIKQAQHRYAEYSETMAPIKHHLIYHYGCNHFTIARFTCTVASCWTKWPALGMVTSVSSLSSQSGVVEHRGEQGGVCEAVDHQHRAFHFYYGEFVPSSIGSFG